MLSINVLITKPTQYTNNRFCVKQIYYICLYKASTYKVKKNINFIIILYQYVKCCTRENG